MVSSFDWFDGTWGEGRGGWDSEARGQRLKKKEQYFHHQKHDADDDDSYDDNGGRDPSGIA